MTIKQRIAPFTILHDSRIAFGIFFRKDLHTKVLEIHFNTIKWHHLIPLHGTHVWKKNQYVCMYVCVCIWGYSSSCGCELVI